MRGIALLVFLLLTGVCSWPALAQTAWHKISSKEGQFTVEMPEKPSIHKSRTRKGFSGPVKILMMGCQAQGATYSVYKMDYPTAVVPGAEEAVLDAERDRMAEDWNGKVIAEKKVRADGKFGRDFTIRAKPGGGDEEVTIRVRQYLDGKAIYLVLVASSENSALPEDAGRFLGSLTFGEGQVRVSGKPEPEPTGTVLKGWGLAIDPNKDCQFLPKAKSLSLQVPGTWHDLNPDGGNFAAPRVVQTVDDNFIVTVKVTGDFQPGGQSNNPKGVPYNGAGILIWNNVENFIRLERGAMLRNGKIGTIVLFEEREGGYRGAMHNEVFPGGDCYLRVERKGSRILGSISFDGAKWKDLQPINTLWPSRLKVGLAAISSSTTPFTVHFAEFKLKRGEL